MISPVRLFAPAVNPLFPLSIVDCPFLSRGANNPEEVTTGTTVKKGTEKKRKGEHRVTPTPVASDSLEGFLGKLVLPSVGVSLVPPPYGPGKPSIAPSTTHRDAPQSSVMQAMYFPSEDFVSFRLATQATHK